MTGYSIALFVHLCSLLLATVAATQTTSLTISLRATSNAEEALRRLSSIERTVRLFPIATLGLIGSGAYLTEEAWTWTTPWIVVSIVGLTLIMMLGFGVEAPRNRALKRELGATGMTAQSRGMLRDPVAWCAKMTTLSLMLAIVFLMTIKPGEIDAIAMMSAAVMVGLAMGLPSWRAQMLLFKPAAADSKPEPSGVPRAPDR